jgi:GWxTD domain-containing protein
MVRSLRVFVSLLLWGGLLLAASTYAQDKQDKKDKSGQGAPQSDKDRQKQNKKLLKELDDQYKDWLNVDVTYLITDEERTAFLRLSTNEERESFIENFWNRRNPNPDSVDNEFKEEHYRRIAYANERYASGIPGWKTDRGRIYIIHGKPDEIESHPAGGAYYRPSDEGGGETSTYPWENWRYRYLECCGTDVNLEFVDPSGSGEFHLTIDPAEKDALLMIPGAGLTQLEAMGLASKTDRFTRTDGTHVGTSLSQSTGSRNNQFDRLELFAKVQAPPAVKFKDLEAVVTARLVRNQIRFEYRTDFLRVTPETVLVPITVQIPNKQLTFNAKDDVHSAVLNLFGRVSTLTGRTVQTFEDVISRDFPDSLLQQALAGSSVYQKSLPLRPGLYRLDLVIKDVQSGNVGVVNVALRVPRYAEDKLESSSMILADQIERVPAKQIGIGQFVLGDSKVRPRMNSEFAVGDNMGVYLQVYNVKVDETTHKSDTAIHFSIKRDKEEQPVFQRDQTGAQIGQTGDQVTIQGQMTLANLAPGKYKFEIQIKDKLANQDLLRSAEFTVKPAAPSPKAAASNSPGR